MSTPIIFIAYINTKKVFFFTLAEFAITCSYSWFLSSSSRDSSVRVIRKMSLLGRRFTAMMSFVAYFSSMFLIAVSSVSILVFPTIFRSLWSAIITIISLFFLLVGNYSLLLFIVLFIRDESHLLAVI